MTKKEFIKAKQKVEKLENSMLLLDVDNTIKAKQRTALSYQRENLLRKIKAHERKIKLGKFKVINGGLNAN